MSNFYRAAKLEPLLHTCLSSVNTRWNHVCAWQTIKNCQDQSQLTWSELHMKRPPAERRPVQQLHGVRRRHVVFIHGETKCLLLPVRVFGDFGSYERSCLQNKQKQNKFTSVTLPKQQLAGANANSGVGKWTRSSSWSWQTFKHISKSFTLHFGAV